MNHQEFAGEIYSKFSNVEGNQHIAALFALQKLLDIVALNKPKAILEIGLGIGSVCCCITKYLSDHNFHFRYDGTEKNDFCLQQLPKNLGPLYSSLNIYADLSELRENQKYDLVIIDGSDASLEKIRDLVAPHGIIFIEGDRGVQSATIRSLFPKHKFVHSISDYKNPAYGPFDQNAWSGGGKLIYTDPTATQYVHYLTERLTSAYRSRFVRK